MRRPKPFPRSRHFEELEFIMRNEPQRFMTMRPDTKRQLAFYLDLKRKSEWREVAA